MDGMDGMGGGGVGGGGAGGPSEEGADEGEAAVEEGGEEGACQSKRRWDSTARLMPSRLARSTRKAKAPPRRLSMISAKAAESTPLLSVVTITCWAKPCLRYQSAFCCQCARYSVSCINPRCSQYHLIPRHVRVKSGR